MSDTEVIDKLLETALRGVGHVAHKSGCNLMWDRECGFCNCGAEENLAQRHAIEELAAVARRGGEGAKG